LFLCIASIEMAQDSSLQLQLPQSRMLSKEESKISNQFAAVMSSTRYRTSLILEQLADGVTRATQLVGVAKKRKKLRDEAGMR